MKKSKRAKRENGIDMISNLPDPILHLILSGLPTTEEVVRTSILSTRWRYLWTSIPSLDIDCDRRLNPQKNFKKNKFKEFVYWVLVNKSLDLESFRLCCSNHYNMSTVGRWIHAATMRKVKLLDLRFCPSEESEDIELPHCLVNCDSLVGLRLFLFRRVLNLPRFTGFPALRVLELNSVELLGDDWVEDFLESCPLLEDLSLIDCLIDKLEGLSISCPNLKTLRIDNRKMADYVYPVDVDRKFERLYEHEGLLYGTLQVSCPKLVAFEYAGHVAYDFFFENLDSLKKAVVFPEYMYQKELSFESMGDNICELFAELSHVESLSLNFYFVQCIDVARDPKGHFPESLPNLKTLELTATIDAFTMDVLIRILRSSPILESLYLIFEKEYLRPEHWKLDDDETREILTCHLKRVKFFEFEGEKEKLVIAGILLEHGNALEEMVFVWQDKGKYKKKSMKTMKKVSAFHKASSTVKLINLVKD